MIKVKIINQCFKLKSLNLMKEEVSVSKNILYIIFIK